MPEPFVEDLKDLAREFLNQKGQQDVEDLLIMGKVKIAQFYLLGAIDRKWHEGKLEDVAARHAYGRLALPPEEAAAIRQRNPH